MEENTRKSRKKVNTEVTNVNENEVKDNSQISNENIINQNEETNIEKKVLVEETETLVKSETKTESKDVKKEIKSNNVSKTNSDSNFIKIIYNGIIKENPIFVLMLGMCPTLATTTSLSNAIGMGIATTFVLLMSNFIISLLRNVIPEKMRIPSYIVIVASFVTVVQLLMQAYFASLYSSLGIYIPLIVVNCIILGRAESYASKNTVIDSIADGLGMGCGFTFGICLISIIRELLGNGSFYDIPIIPKDYNITIFILAPGAFLVLAFIIAIQNFLNNKNSTVKSNISCDFDCSNCDIHKGGNK